MDLIDPALRYVSGAFPFKQTTPLVTHHRICIFILDSSYQALERYLRMEIEGTPSSLELEGFKNGPD